MHQRRCATSEGTTPHRSDFLAPARVALADRSQAYGAGLRSKGLRRRWHGLVNGFPFLENRVKAPRTYLQTALVLEALFHLAAFAVSEGAQLVAQLGDVVYCSLNAVCTLALLELPQRPAEQLPKEVALL